MVIMLFCLSCQLSSKDLEVNVTECWKKNEETCVWWECHPLEKIYGRFYLSSGPNLLVFCHPAYWLLLAKMECKFVELSTKYFNRQMRGLHVLANKRFQLSSWCEPCLSRRIPTAGTIFWYNMNNPLIQYGLWKVWRGTIQMWPLIWWAIFSGALYEESFFKD